MPEKNRGRTGKSNLQSCGAGRKSQKSPRCSRARNEMRNASLDAQDPPNAARELTLDAQWHATRAFFGRLKPMNKQHGSQCHLRQWMPRCPDEFGRRVARTLGHGSVLWLHPPPRERAVLTRGMPKPPDAALCIVDTVPIVGRTDKEKFNADYRNKRTFLEIYDALSRSIHNGRPFRTRLARPLADRRCCHPARPLDT